MLRQALEYPADAYTKSWMKIEAQVGLIANYAKKTHLQAAIAQKAVAFVLSVKRQHSTLNTTPQPWHWFKMQEHVNDSKESKIYAKSGEEMLNQAIDTKTDMVLSMNFAHTAKHLAFIFNWLNLMLFLNVQLQPHSDELKLSNYMAAHKAKGPIANVKILRSYLSGDGSKGEIPNGNRQKAGKNN